VDNFINSHEKPKAAATAGPPLPQDKMTFRIILLSRAPKKDKMTLRITLIVKASKGPQERERQDDFTNNSNCQGHPQESMFLNL